MGTKDSYKAPEDEDQVDGEQQSADLEDDDIELEVIDDTPPEDRGRKPLDRDVEDPTDEEVAEYSDKVQKRMKELTHARHDERRAKEAALREREEAARIAQQLFEENRKLRESYNAGAQQYTEVMASKAEMELQVARQKLREAQESYDTDAIIEAQEELAAARFRFERAKTFQPKALQTQQEEVYVSPTPQQSPVQVDEKATRWQARNQWFGQDDEMTSLALAVHKKLVDARIDPRSEEYYERIDARMREVFPDYFGETRKDPKRPASVVAAPTRTSGKKKVVLTKTQEALARRFNLTNEQYAKEVLKLSSET
jgi:LysM repeat protein